MVYGNKLQLLLYYLTISYVARNAEEYLSYEAYEIRIVKFLAVITTTNEQAKYTVQLPPIHISGNISRSAYIQAYCLACVFCICSIRCHAIYNMKPVFAFQQ